MRAGSGLSVASKEEGGSSGFWFWGENPEEENSGFFKGRGG